MGITPEETVVFLLAVNLRQEPEEEQQPQQPKVIFANMLDSQPSPEEAQANKQETEKYIAKQQRTEAMQISSMLVTAQIASEKSPDEIWGMYQEFYAKVHNKMIQDNDVDKMLGDTDKDNPDKPENIP